MVISHVVYYAFREKETNLFLAGTDYGDYSPIFASNYSTPKLFSGYELKTEIVRRHIDLGRFEIVPAYCGRGIIATGSAYEGFPPELEEASL